MKNPGLPFLSARFLLTALFVVASTSAVLAQGPDMPAELKVLARYIGKWKYEIVLKPAEWTKKEMRVTVISTNEWVLNGWFQHHKVKHDDGFEGIDILTYDPRKKAYRSWSFDSFGNSNEMTGEWDEKTKTLTSKGDFGMGVTSVAKMRFIDADNREMTMIAKDASGKVYLDIHGKMSRQK